MRFLLRESQGVWSSTSLFALSPGYTKLVVTDDAWHAFWGRGGSRHAFRPTP